MTNCSVIHMRKILKKYNESLYNNEENTTIDEIIDEVVDTMDINEHYKNVKKKKYEKTIDKILDKVKKDIEIIFDSDSNNN